MIVPIAWPAQIRRAVQSVVAWQPSSCAGHVLAPGHRRERIRAARMRTHAPQADEAVRQHTTGEKVPELLLHEHRQAGALGVVSRRV